MRIHTGGLPRVLHRKLATPATVQASSVTSGQSRMTRAGDRTQDDRTTGALERTSPLRLTSRLSPDRRRSANCS